MTDWKKLNGIPWKFNGRTYDGVDCVGLLFLVSEENQWGLTPDDGKQIEHEWYQSDPLRLVRFLVKNFEKINDIEQLKENDVVYFVINGEGHVGMYIGYGKFMQAFPPPSEMFTTQTEIQRIRNIKQYFRCGFRYRR